MKKIASLICILTCLIACTMFTGCNNKNSIDMGFYFNSTVSTQVYKDNSTKSSNLELSKVISSSPYEADKFLQYVLNAQNTFYGMYVESISFWIYSNQTREEEFALKLTGTENGKETVSSEVKYFEEEQFPLYLKANNSIKVTINVNDTITLKSGCSLTINPYDKIGAFLNTEFKYCIYGLEIVGYHK